MSGPQSLVDVRNMARVRAALKRIEDLAKATTGEDLVLTARALEWLADYAEESTAPAKRETA
jgi:hypothetical protein